MAKNEKTIQDFYKSVEEIKQKYTLDQLNYQMKFNFKSEKFEGYDIFYITNQLKATKIMFDHQMKLLVVREIFVNEAKLISEMVSELHG